MRLGTCITDTFLLPAGSYCHGNEETHWMLRPCVYCDNGVRVCVCVYVIVSPVCMCTSSTATSDNLKFVYRHYQELFIVHHYETCGHVSMSIHS